MNMDTTVAYSTEQISEIRPEDSASNVGSSVSKSSRTSSIRSQTTMLRVQDARREAELLQRAAAMERVEFLEEQRKMLISEGEFKLKQMELETLKLRTELDTTIHKMDIERDQFELQTEINIVRAKAEVADQAIIDPEHFSQPFKNPLLTTSTPAATQSKPSILDPEHFGCQSRIPPPIATTPAATQSKHITGISSNSISNESGILVSALNVLSDSILMQNNKKCCQLPEKFSGGVLEYPMWMQSFETLVEDSNCSVREKMYYLRKCVAGEALNAIKGLLGLSTEEAYERAKTILKQRYGNPYLTARALKGEIKAWPVIKYGDTKGLLELSDHLNNFSLVIKHSDYFKSLDNEEIIGVVLSKLPRSICERWARIADQWFVDSNTYPPFSEFCKLLEKESRIGHRFMGSYQSYGSSNVNRQSNENSKKRTSDMQTVRSFATQVEGKQHTSSDKCFVCDEAHKVSQCKQFLNLNWEEKREVLKKKGLCFGCLDEKHLIKGCMNRKKCDKCSGIHPTALHRDRIQVHLASSSDQVDDCFEPESEEINTVVSLHTDGKNGVLGHYNSLIVPVYIMHSNSNQRVLIYALLDDQSNSSFISKKTMANLGIEDSGRHTSLKLTTMFKSAIIESKVLNGLSVVGVNSIEKIPLGSVYSRDSIPTDRSLIPRSETALEYKHLKHLSTEIMPYREDIEVGLLIGLDCSKAIKPRELISGPGDLPWAVKTVLGWGIAGLLDPIRMENIVGDKSVHFAFRTQAAELKRGCLPEVPSQGYIDGIKSDNLEPGTTSVGQLEMSTVLKMFDVDLLENTANAESKVSVHDRKFLDIMSKGLTQLPNGHIELPLPLKQENVILPNNKESVLKRLNGLRNRLLRNEQYRKDYCNFMDSIFENGYAEAVPVDELDLNDGHVWYIPHHGVYHPRKKDKICVVFDCSMEIAGQGLNQNLLQGPNQINNIVGVLLRFRQEPVAFSMDIEGMFHQVFVKREYRNYLRFLWWKNHDFSQAPQEFRMTVHLFGATSSPGCANYALRATADLYEKKCGSTASNFVKQNFYVDDGLKSVESVDEALQLMKDTRQLCANGGFNLHKIVCNRKEVLASVPAELCAKDLQQLDLNYDKLPIERTLGIEWVVEIDKFQFRITLNNKPCTRRGILSTVSSIFDPLGLVSPFVMTGKGLLQAVLQDKADWDDPVPDNLAMRWEQWKYELNDLANIKVERCYKDTNFGSPVKVELHHFSDASLTGYGECSYVRQINKSGKISTALVMAKSRVAPTKSMTVPRLELTAAVTAAKIANLLNRELDYSAIDNYFWTDSKVVLGYIRNEAKRFHIFVANRVQQIHDMTRVRDWNFVSTVENPADIASRGATPMELQNSHLWWHGPEFLQEGLGLPSNDIFEELQISDPNVRQTVVHAVDVVPELASIEERLQYFSCWYRAKRAIAVCIRFIDILKTRRNKIGVTELQKDLSIYKPVNVAELDVAENIILKSVQARYFSEEIQILRPSISLENNMSGKRVRGLKHTSSIYRLDPYLGEDGLIHVGGRIQRANVPRNIVHPVIVPQKCHIANLIVSFYHQRVHHSGREMTLNEIRSSGYWILQARTVVTSFIWKCVKCCKYRGNTAQQKMSDLPSDRVESTEPFSFAAVDYFGPFYIKEGRSEKKRWGVIFVCMASRAIHLETANSLDTDSFLNGYRRFIARRGPVRQLRSDRGTNFVGSKSELNKALSEMDHGKISREMLKNSCDWIEFKMNVPLASHMGGSWERLIRSVRSVLNALLDSHGDKLDDESLRTLFTEAEVVVNSRPITYTDTTNADSREPLSPIQLLTLKSRLVLPPPGEFQKEDIYCKRRWRKVQFLADQFWKRWKNEYLSSLQERKLWVAERENLCVGDVVLVKDDNLSRNNWPLGRVTEVHPSADGLVRKVSVRFGEKTFERPIQKLVLINGGARQGAQSEV